jgi:nitrate/TMAO reductase-like tetraheme cytochrome c subunit
MMSDTEQTGEDTPRKNPESGKRTRATVDRLKRLEKRRTWKSIFKTMTIVVVVLIVLAAISVGGAEYYTSQPTFCGSCHIMDPYYESWHEDIHGGKLGIKCVDCHYAPGEKFTFHAKFKGLSQAVSYFSGRAGASRPRAHVSNESCLRSGCHGDHKFMDEPLQIGDTRVEDRWIGDRKIEVTRAPTVTYYHKKHLEVEDRLKENAKEIIALRDRLEAELPADLFDQIREIAVSVEPTPERRLKMAKLFTETGDSEKLDAALQLMTLEHAKLRLKQLAGLNCAACHTYDASGMNHLRVEHTTCFTCHFTNEAFNQNTSECLKCHDPPMRPIMVHEASLVPTSREAAPVMMNHEDIIARGMKCESCHLDVVQGTSSVSARECAHCHDQARYTRDFATRTTETVQEYHQIHVAEQRARCPDCHSSVTHELIEPSHVATSANFLEPVVNDCQHCHPDHHREQVELLQGVGGEGVSRPMPNAMFGSRMNCHGCHTQPGTDFKGDELIAATEQTCVACHGDDYRTLFEQWMHEIETYLKDAEASLARVQARISDIEAGRGEVPEQVRQAVEVATHNIQLVKNGNAIHNKHYGLQLLDVSIRGLDQAMVLMRPKLP